MNVWKKALSLVMALSLTLSLIVLPAGAAENLVVRAGDSTVKAGETVTVDLSVKNNTGFRGLQLNIYYNSDLLECTAVGAGAAWSEFRKNAGDNDTVTLRSNADNTSITMPTGKKAASFAYVADVETKTGFAADGVIGTLTFKAKADLESTSATIEVEVVEAVGPNNETVTAGPVNGTLTIVGGAPVLDSVTLPSGGDSVEIDGTTAKTVQATAKSAKGTDITASVEWSVSPAGQGVTVEKGLITVDGKAKAGAYTVTAKSGSVEKSVTVTVTRAASTATSVAILRGGKAVTEDTLIIPAAGSAEYTYTAELLDQYGDKMTGEAATWAATNTPTGVQFTNGKVTVPSTQGEAEFTVTATISGKSGSVNVSLKRISITWPTATVSGVYGQTWSEIVKLSGGSAELNGANVPGKFSVKGESEHPGAGEQPYVINFKSTDGQYDVDSDAKTATIAKLAVTIKMNDHKAAYGDTFKYYQFDTVITGKPLLFSDTVTATASGDAKGDGTDAVGTYKIHGSATHANYAITVTDGTLTIEKKGVNPAETLPSLTIVGAVATTTDPDTGRTVITGTIQATSPEAQSEEELLKAVTAINPGMVPNVTKFTVTVNGNAATFTFKSWRLAPGQKFNGPGTYEIIPDWECSDASIAQNYEPNLPKLFVEVKGKSETLTVADGRTWTLYVSEVMNAGRLNGLLPTHAYYSDGTSVKIQGWTYTDGTEVTLSNLKNRAERGRNITLYPVVTPSYLEVESLTVRFVDDTGSSSSGSTGNSGTGGHISITLDPEKIFLNGDLPNDVSKDYWAAPYIGWAYQRGVMNGTGNGNFSPNGLTNRQQLWMVLARLSGEKPLNMAAARAWAMSNGISDGTNPGGSLTRQQLVAMLYRYAQMRGCDLTASGELGNYNDARNVSSYARQAMAWAVGNGIVTGTADLRLNPQGTATRSHFAAMMFRFCVKYNV
nr:S-layer homology domain-containing protein [uncultured Oscillibacter sp.]